METNSTLDSLKNVLRAITYWAMGAITILVIYTAIGLAMHDPLWIVQLLDVPLDKTILGNTLTVVIVISFAFCFYASVVYSQLTRLLGKMERYQDSLSKSNAFARMEIKENNRFMGILVMLGVDGDRIRQPYYGSQVMYMMTNEGKVYPRVITSTIGLGENFSMGIYEIVETVSRKQAEEYVHGLIFGQCCDTEREAATYILSIWEKLPMLEMKQDALIYLRTLSGK